ncbi:MAG: 2-dehydro-3-deoxygalactonokinase [Yoonia sp.]|uniref:2-dehydro-3-deoxygalactonokinase n=1 Tax=Yoonia sp. TaxID=2212373 RepID=UPI0032649D4C
MTDTITPDWIAADWGTSNLRVWAMSDSGDILAEASSDQGMGKLDRTGFEPALRDVAGKWINGPITVVACGMVGARQGWAEAKYDRVPCPAATAGFTKVPTDDPDLSVHIIPGISQDSPADVMRGEETQIAGFLSRNPNWDGIICLPGSHTKWVHVSADEIVSFQTYMTGELFAAISGHTVLKHSVDSIGWDDSVFETAVSETMSRPEKLAANLFSLRADGLLHNMTNEAARSRLSGLLIGAELTGARPYWLGQQIAVIGAGDIAGLYVKALGLQGAPATQVQGDSVTLAGLIAAYRRLKG